MVEKMKFISITGRKEQFDHVLDTYLQKHDIQLENALTELKNVPNLRPFTEPNPYKTTLSKVNALLALTGPAQLTEKETMPPIEEIMERVNALSEKLGQIEEERKTLSAELSQLQHYKKTLQPYQPLELNFADVLHFSFIRTRFGRIPARYYRNFKEHVDEMNDTLFYPCETTSEYVFGAYFVAANKKERIDTILASLHFETISLTDLLPDDLENTENPFAAIDQALADIDAQLRAVNKQILDEIDVSKEELTYVKQVYENLSSHFNVRKYAARLEDEFILCGWMTETDANALMKESEHDEDTTIMFEDPEENTISPPPTKLKNPRIFKPFQMFVRMYGLPAQNEIDPTIFVALTYAFIFGWMFGDVGQGAVLTIGGFLIYRIKKMDLAGVIGYAGIFSMFFGFMFGSVFGFEDILPAIWLRPITQMSTLPFIGKLNTVFIVAVAFGMILNLIVMILNIINGIRAKKPEDAVFHQNGIAGFIFYGALTATIFLFMTGHKLPAAIVLVLMFMIPLLLIALKEPLCNLLKKKTKLLEEGPVMYILQSFFELFDVLLSYFSNTVSFLRIGAFAVSHAAMMEVVLMLAGAANGSPNMVVVVLGNIVVCALEGLIVGIQVLRLEYYELFSRFYRGSGREFVPYKNEETN